MKTRFNTFDIVCGVAELQRLIGMRVNNVYDIDNKTYLIKLQRSEEKAVLLLESGNRFHSTVFEWPKNVAPSGFSMKMRKHISNKRLEKFCQLGTDRIVDLQFGTKEAAYHIILELYDRGNIILTDHDFVILYILRPHTEGEEIRFAVKEKYPLNRARETHLPNLDELKKLLDDAKEGIPIKKLLVPHFDFGPPLIEHCLLEVGLNCNGKIRIDFNADDDNLNKILKALQLADSIIEDAKISPNEGFIIQKKEARASQNLETEYYFSNQEFHPLLFAQHKHLPHLKFPSYNVAVDEFFSSLESQKIDLKAIQQEREALKKLENVRKDHDHRLQDLEKTQEIDKQKAELITRNQELVGNTILAIQKAIASQMSWSDIKQLVKEAQAVGDPIALTIKNLKLETNHISLLLSDPYVGENSGESELKPMIVDVDIDLSAFANARKYYDLKRSAAKKQQKTIESRGKALKSAEKKTKKVLKEMQTITNISKARKVYWFEKFFWFISSENYLVIGGRDQQQNELIVKRYMKPNDIYVHAEIQGASSVVIKNHSDQPIPPKTLIEAGTMAISYSVAWQAKVVTKVWWVHANQVSKTAPTGEYLTTGSFMIRGKKNYLPPCHLIMGLSFLFKLEDSSLERHKDERKIRITEDDTSLVFDYNEENLNETEDQSNSDSESSSDSGDGFPKTLINIPSFSETKLTESIDYMIINEEKSTKIPSKTQNKPKVQIKEVSSNVNETKEKQLTRGQRKKLKKINEKYKDQDEDERQLMMDIHKSSMASKKDKKSKKGKEESNQQKKQKVNQPLPEIIEGEELNLANVEEEVVEVQAAAEVDIIDSLTGQPVAEDELLFAVPVVAPYNTLTNYKYKVKLIPGTGKRGKAAKTALNMFLKDKTATQREKDLLKSVRDDMLARNIPGKVKLSAPKLQNAKK